MISSAVAKSHILRRNNDSGRRAGLSEEEPETRRASEICWPIVRRKTFQRIAFAYGGPPLAARMARRDQGWADGSELRVRRYRADAERGTQMENVGD
jgi:hypothetical protein